MPQPKAAPAGDDEFGLVSLSGITKSFGPTLANAEIDLRVSRGDVIGLVGGNGAGKSTLMRILCGAVWPTLGEIAFGSEKLDFATYDTAEAQRRGIRMVHQELSLCTNLSVAENFFLETPEEATWWPGWRGLYRQRARTALEAVFPANAIDVDAAVSRLTIAEHQMVEIARAIATPGVRLIILDEPTSSLDLERALQLRRFIHEKARQGLAFIFISHKLQELIDLATGIVVLRNGRVVWRGEGSDVSLERLVQLMGGDANAIHGPGTGSAREDHEVVVRLGGMLTADLGRNIEIRRGEIVGLAGLEGSGQKELLHTIFAAGGAHAGSVQRRAEASFIAGDRQAEGIFPLWNVLANISIARVAGRPALGVVSERLERAAAIGPATRLKLDLARLQSNIRQLSGGNQQKALVARALAANPPLLLLDDPTRGVDVVTKRDFYQVCSEMAEEGRTLVWRTTEDAELLAADRVLVFAGGRIVKELTGSAVTEEAIVGGSFTHARSRDRASERNRAPLARLARATVNAAPFIGLAIVLAVMVWANPAVASLFGIDLLLLPAIPLVLITVAQMFAVGGSEIDLGVGAFAALASVVAATLLFDQPLLGAGALILLLIGYAGVGGLIQVWRIPAIVVTLGASFVWFGIGYSLQATPGGASPDWLTNAVNWSFLSVPSSLILVAGIALMALLIDRTPLGVALRGFGNNADAMVRSGWSPTKYGALRYLISGLFAASAGLALTAINTASDINSGSTFTLLSVAAVVMGGCSLIGGIVSPIAVVVGAVTLSLIGALLGVLSVSSDFNAAAQGLVLISLLALRSLAPYGRT